MNKHIELPALLDKVGQHIEAALCIDDGWADRIMHMDKARKHLAAYRAVIAAHEQARVVGEPVATGPLSYVCANGCGYCGVRLSDFVTHQTMDQECDVWRVVASEPQIVSTCCGSAVEVWDERKQDVTGTVEIASPPAPQEAQADSTPLLPVARIRSWTKHGEGHGDLVDWLEGSENLPDGEYDLYLGPQSEQKPVASIYISPNGEREFDDWKHDLPIGRNELFAAPVAQPATEQAEAPDSYDAIWNALQRIDSAAAMLPSYTVDHEGDIGAFTQNIVDAITRLTPPAQAVQTEDTQLLNWLRDECCDLRCISVPTGGDDYDVRWVVIQHHMAEPREREIGESFTDDPRDAIRAARTRGNGVEPS